MNDETLEMKMHDLRMIGQKHAEAKSNLTKLSILERFY